MRSIERLMAIFESFDVARPRLTLQEIADEIGLPKSSTFRLVNGLREAGYLVRADDLHFSLSLRFVRLAAMACGPGMDIPHVARPVIDRLAEVAGESVTLNTIENRCRVRLAVANAGTLLAGLSRPGRDLPLGLGSASLVLLAFLPEQRREQLLNATARRASCGKRELRSILDTVWRQGHAVSHGGGGPGLSGISAPVFDLDGQASLSLSILVPTERVRDRVGALTDLARESAHEISRRLGNNPRP